MDMSSAIMPKSDQINADDLLGGPMTITVREVQIKGGQEQPVSIYFDGSEKAFRPCKSMSRILVACWGPDAKQYTGRSITLYRDPSVKWGGMEVGGIRISNLSHMDKPMTMALTATKGTRKLYTVSPIVAVSQDHQRSAKPQAEAVVLPTELREFVEFWTSEADTSENAAQLGQGFNQAMKTADWNSLRDVDAGAAQALKRRVTEQVARLKEDAG